MMTVSSILSLVLVGSALVQALPGAPVSTVTVTKTVDKECPSSTPTGCPVCIPPSSTAKPVPADTPAPGASSGGSNKLDNTSGGSPGATPNNTSAGGSTNRPDNPTKTPSDSSSTGPKNTGGPTPNRSGNPTKTPSDSSSTGPENTSGATPSPKADKHTKCKGMKDAKYIAADKAEDVIRNKFCPEASQQTAPDENSRAISRVYFKDTKDEFQVAIEWASRKEFKQITKEECESILVGKILKTCDLPDKENNPNNWKGGGHRKERGATYHIIPLAQSYYPGTMRIDVHEQLNDDKKGVSTTLGIYTDGHGKGIFGLKYGDATWGYDMVADARQSHLPWDLKTTFAKELQKRADGENEEYKEYPLQFEYGNTKWDNSITDESKFPHCLTEVWHVGKDGGNPQRWVSCYYKYPEKSPF